MSNPLKRAAGRLRHFVLTRGNGVQSPFAYNFAWQVVCNKSAYYAYLDLSEQLRALAPRERKLAKLLFRLANFAQPSLLCLDSSLPDAYAACLQRGCTAARLAPLPPEDEAHRLLIVSTAPPLAPANWQPGSMIVQPGIHDSRADLERWQQLAAMPQATLTFDLYDCGIAIAAPDRYKQHFNINF